MEYPSFLRQVSRTFGVGLTLLASSLSMQTLHATQSRGIVYVESNAKENAIIGFQRDADGNLRPLPGSPFATGGAGVVDTQFKGGAAFDSDQNLLVDPKRELLFAVNGGSDSISVLHIEADGKLSPTEGSPFSSGGMQPVSVGLANDTLIVVNKSADPNRPTLTAQPSYNTFKLADDGFQAPIIGSKVLLPPGSSPSQAFIAGQGKIFIDADLGAQVIRSYRIDNDGQLELVDQKTLPAQEFAVGAQRIPLGLSMHPTEPLIYVGFATAAKIGVYSYDEAGHLNFLTTAPNSGRAVCWTAVDKAGKHLYTSNNADHSVSVYDLSDAKKPREIQHYVLKGSASSFQLNIDPSGEFLYVLTQRTSASTSSESGNALHMMRIDSTTGLVKELPSSPTPLMLPAGVRPQGVVSL